MLIVPHPKTHRKVIRPGDKCSVLCSVLSQRQKICAQIFSMITLLVIIPDAHVLKTFRRALPRIVRNEWELLWTRSRKHVGFQFLFEIGNSFYKVSKPWDFFKIYF